MQILSISQLVLHLYHCKNTSWVEFVPFMKRACLGHALAMHWLRRCCKWSREHKGPRWGLVKFLPINAILKFPDNDPIMLMVLVIILVKSSIKSA